MSNPIVVDLPHRLGREEAKRRIANGISGLESYLPGGGNVRSAWQGDRLTLDIKAMGQEVSARIDVEEQLARVEVLLPPALAFFGRAIEAALKRKGTDLLEDKRSG